MNMKTSKSILIIALLSFLSRTIVAQNVADAQKLTENEQYEAATVIFKKLISTDPNNGTNYYYYGENVLLSEGNDSSKIFETGLQVDPTNSLNRIGLAKALLNRINLKQALVAKEKDPSDALLGKRADEAVENKAKAIVMLDEVVKNGPQKSATLYVEAADALIHFRTKDLEKAKTYLDKAVTIEPKNPQIQLLYGDLYAELNNGSLSADYYNHAMELKPNWPHAICNKGRLYRRSTNYEGAAVEFKAAIAIDPNYAPAHRELGETCFKLGKLEEAKAEYKTYLQLSSNNCSARIRYGSFLYLSKDYNAAISEMETVLSNCELESTQALRILAISYYETKNYSKGLEFVNRVFGLVPTDRLTEKDYEYSGKLLIATGQDSMGIERLKVAYAMEPSRTDLLSEMATIYSKAKRYTEAITVLTEKINTGKEVKSADYFNLGRAQYLSGLYPASDSSFAKVNEVSPKYATGYLWRAKANTQLDSTSENGLAKPFYEKYIELAVADSVNATKYQGGLAEAYGYLAYYYILKNDKVLALDYLKKKSLLPLEAEDQKNVLQAIKQLEGK